MCLGRNRRKTKQKYYYKRLTFSKYESCLCSPLTKIPFDFKINKWMKFSFWKSIFTYKGRDVVFEFRGLGKIYVWNSCRISFSNSGDTYWLLESYNKKVLTDGNQSVLRKFRVLGQVIGESKKNYGWRNRILGR